MDRYCISACMRKDDSGLEDELEYFWDAPISSDSDKCEEDRRWSPGPREPSSEEDEEEVQFLTNLLRSEPREGEEEEGEAPPRSGLRQARAVRGARPRRERQGRGKENL
jgi:hypothetical protein